MNSSDRAVLQKPQEQMIERMVAEIANVIVAIASVNNKSVVTALVITYRQNFGFVVNVLILSERSRHRTSMLNSEKKLQQKSLRSIM